MWFPAACSFSCLFWLNFFNQHVDLEEVDVQTLSSFCLTYSISTFCLSLVHPDDPTEGFWTLWSLVPTLQQLLQPSRAAVPKGLGIKACQEHITFVGPWRWVSILRHCYFMRWIASSWALKPKNLKVRGRLGGEGSFWKSSLMETMWKHRRKICDVNVCFLPS